MNKTGISEAAIAAFITSLILGFMPFFGLSVDASQALNIGLALAALAAWVIRWKHKRKGRK